MKRTLSRRLLLLLLLVPFTHLISYSQDLTGIWRGYFITESGDQYKFELQLKQTGNTISGVSYSYLTTVFYGKATLTGNFSRTGQSALIKEIRTVEVRMSGLSSACIMKCMFEFEQSGKEQFLQGTFTSKHEKDGLTIKRGDDCGGGRVYLRKVTTSDFYIEPFLRPKRKDSPVIVNKAPIKKDTVKTRVNTPVVKNPVITTKPVVKNPNTTKTNPIVKQKTDTTEKTNPVGKINPAGKPSTPEVLKTRQNELVKTLIVTDPDVIVKLYDNGEIDDDTISVYLDKKLVLSGKRLTASPLTIKLKMDEDNSEHELVMVAENLGRIPPNTSLMIVESGDQRFDVRITSTSQKNAMVRFRYQKPKQSNDSPK
jgi:hypothetical protein